jgi:hypothetical protein
MNKIIVVLFLALILFGCNNGSDCNWDWKDKSFKDEIISLKTSNEISGSFFLGCGSIEGETYYFYYKKIKDNIYKLEKSEALETIIIEDGNTYIEYTMPYRECSGETWETQRKNIKIHVPKETIIKEFKL